MSKGRKAPSRAIYGCGGDPIDDDLADDWCTVYHGPGDCGLPGHGAQHKGATMQIHPADYEAKIERLQKRCDAMQAHIDRLQVALKRIAGRCDAEAAYKIACAALMQSSA